MRVNMQFFSTNYDVYVLTIAVLRVLFHSCEIFICTCFVERNYIGCNKKTSESLDCVGCHVPGYFGNVLFVLYEMDALRSLDCGIRSF